MIIQEKRRLKVNKSWSSLIGWLCCRVDLRGAGISRVAAGIVELEIFF
jgi:hypothetical protein